MPSDLSRPDTMEATLAKIQQHQHAIQDFSRLLASYMPVERLLSLTALRLTRGGGVQHAKVLRFDGTRGDLVLAAGMGWRPEAVGKARSPIDAASPQGRTYQTRMPTLVGDLPGSAEFRLSDLMREHGILSLVNVPIISEGTVWGVLEMDSTRPDHFDEHDARFLQVMANILGVAIERAADQREARLAAADAAARADAESKAQTLLMHEIQHRMKNNLAVISSMLMLEQRQHADARVKARLRALMDRVMAIGLAHDQLSIGGDGTGVDLAAYLAQLAGNLGLQHGTIRLETELEKITAPPEHAVPVGLIVNELITNAVKYAFPNGVGTIRVELHRDPQGEAVLRVADDGVGMGPPRPGGLGTMLLGGLAGQIGGFVARPAVKCGTVVEVRFPITTVS